MNTLSVIVPCYCEEEVLPDTASVLLRLLIDMIEKGVISSDSFICFVNDGSRDRTWQIINELHQKDSVHYKGICLSRNFGHQSALLSALHTVEADLYVTIDADLQDDENAICDMVEAAGEGNDIVYGVRIKRESDSLFKKITALFFYKLMNFLGTRTIYNHADFRLMSRRSVIELRKYGESNIYLRGLVTELGFPSKIVYYDRKSRTLGESKYPLGKMLALAWTGITSFSVKPLRLAVYIGAGTCLFSVLMLVYCLWTWQQGDALAGWTSIVMLSAFFSGIQMVLLGIIGEYIGKIFIETKKRQLFIISDKLQ